jgi:predicted nucleic-acid-binding protein
MKAVGLDTCVVVRLLIGEPEEQAKAAMKYVEQCYYEGIQVCVSDIVIGEAYYALIYHYGVEKLEAIHSLRDLLKSPMITTAGHALSVLEEYRGKGAGLMDRLIRMDYLNSVHQVVTFDKEMARLSNVQNIKK